MVTAGIVAEYNPFHLGHQYQVERLRAILGECAVVAVMSGNFVQRGEPAIAGKLARAEAAVRCGVDLVLELPTVYAASTAEIFARGGVALLAATGVVTHLCFSSECGDLALLQQAAQSLDHPDYSAVLRGLLDQGLTFAAARQQAAASLGGDAAACLSQPNNNLGVEYLRAAHALGDRFVPVTIKRVGAGHDSTSEEQIASASAIRHRMLTDEPWEQLVPAPVAEILRREMAAGRAPNAVDRCERAILGKLRQMTEADFVPYDGGKEGLYHRFYDAVHTGATLEEILELAKTKRYTHARLRRMALAAWLELPKAPAQPPYLRVLAANCRGREVLRGMKKKAELPILTKPGDVRRLGGEAEEFLERESRCTDLYALTYPNLQVPGEEYTTGPVMIDDDF